VLERVPLFIEKEEQEEEPECEYYEDEWIFGDGAPLGPQKNDTEGNGEESDDGECCT